MLKYNIDWYLAFKGEVSTSLISNLTKTLGLSPENCVKYEDADLTYRISRSLDICMPIILTKCIDLNIEVFRDCTEDKFIILVSN